MHGKITSIMELIKASNFEEARKQVDALAQTMKSERDRGSLMALNGILTSISKGKEGTLQSWQPEKVARAANMIRKSQMADDWDRGYAEVLVSYSKLDKKTQ